MTDSLRILIVRNGGGGSILANAALSEPGYAIESLECPTTATLRRHLTPSPDLIIEEYAAENPAQFSTLFDAHRMAPAVPIIVVGRNGARSPAKLPSEVTAYISENDENGLRSVLFQVLEIKRLRADNQRLESALAHRLEFESLLTTLSTRFIHSSSHEIDGVISWAVQQVGEFTGVDRCFALQLDEDATKAYFTHEWCAEGLTPNRERYPIFDLNLFTWAKEMHNRFQYVYIPDVECLPDEAAHEKALYRLTGTRSFVIVPIAVDRHLLGALGLATERMKRTWLKQDIRMLETVAQMFANALERQRKDTALHRSEAQFREFANRLPIAVAIHDAAKFLFVNKAAGEMSGYAPEEVLGQDLLSFIHPEDEPPVRRRLKELDAGAQEDRREVRILNKAGEGRWVEAQSRTIEFEGKRAYLVAAIETTERHRAAEALRESEEHLRLVVQNMPVMMDAFDAVGNIIVWNGECERVTGYSSDEIVGNPQSLEWLYPDETYRRRVCEMMAADSADFRDWEWQITCKDGSLRTISWFNISSRFPIPGWASWAVGMDVTDRKRLEKQVLEISAREQIRIGQDLHDRLGQHLTGIGFKGQLLAQELAERNLPEADTAAMIVELVSEAITQTRNLARGLYPVQIEADGLMTALHELAAQVEHVYDVACRFVCEEPVLVYDNAAATHLYRIAQEAANNAVKHGKPTAVEIGLAPEGETVLLTIRDDGLGITPGAELNEGLGLSIMGYRARMLDGSLAVAPRPEGGTLVTCSFPMSSVFAPIPAEERKDHA